jgi:hypothetical protein
MEPIFVTCNSGKPHSLSWRGQSHMVVCVLDHWWEAGRWWETETAKEFFLVLTSQRRILLCRNPNSGDWLAKSA